MEVQNLPSQSQENDEREEQDFTCGTGHKGILYSFTWWLIIASVIILIPIIAGNNLPMWGVITIYVIACGIAWLDQEVIDMRSIASVENAWTKKPVCNFTRGRHWRRFFSFRVRNIYDNTPNKVEVTVNIRNKEEIFVSCKVSIWPSIVNPLQFEATGIDDAKDYVESELKDYSETQISKMTLEELESSSELKKLRKDIETQLNKVLRQSGLKLKRNKIDIVDLDYNKSIKESTERQFIENANAKTQEIKNDQFKYRLNKKLIEKHISYISKKSYEAIIKEATDFLEQKGNNDPKPEEIVSQALTMAREQSKDEIKQRGESLTKIENKVEEDLKIFERVFPKFKYEGLDGKNTLATVSVKQ